jgi:hypothetical protein
VVVLVAGAILAFGWSGRMTPFAMTDDLVVLVVMNADGKPALRTTTEIGLSNQETSTTSTVAKTKDQEMAR